MTPLSFIVPYAPVAKARPRAARTETGVTMYTPAETAAYEERVAQEAARAMAGRPLLRGPLYMNLRFYYPVAAKIKPDYMGCDGEAYPALKPDLDNVEKAVKDALNRVVWSDDCQVCEVMKGKRFAIDGYPRVEIEIGQL